MYTSRFENPYCRNYFSNFILEPEQKLLLLLHKHSEMDFTVTHLDFDTLYSLEHYLLVPSSFTQQYYYIRLSSFLNFIFDFVYIFNMRGFHCANPIFLPGV
jgi:hypothetical protein